MSGIEAPIILGAVFSALKAIKENVDDAKRLPEMANRLKNRTLSFEPRILEIQDRPDDCARLALPLEQFLYTAKEVHSFLDKLNSRSSSFRKFFETKDLIRQHQELQLRLDRCRDDLQFQMVTDLRVEAQAYEDDLRGLVQIAADRRTSIDQDIVHSMMGEMLEILRSTSLGDASVLEDAQTVLDSPNNPMAALEEQKHREIQRLEIPSPSIKRLEQIGQGSFGLVYHAEYNGTDIALKELYRDKGDPKNMEEENTFIDEVHTQSKCRSRYIAHMYGFSRSFIDGTLYAVMELAPYGSLGGLLSYATGKDGVLKLGRTEATLQVNAIVLILHEIALGMEFLHSRCVLHRDIKPPNVLLSERLTPKLTDFGLAREIQGEYSRTMTAMVGTYYYMAPELISKSGRTVRYTYTADVYSFGALMVEICQKTYGGGKHGGSVDGGLPEQFPQELGQIKDRCIAEVGRERYGRGSNEGALLSSELARVVGKIGGSPRQRISPGHEGFSELIVFAKLAADTSQAKFSGHSTSTGQLDTSPTSVTTYSLPSSGQPAQVRPTSFATSGPTGSRPIPPEAAQLNPSHVVQTSQSAERPPVSSQEEQDEGEQLNPSHVVQTSQSAERPPVSSQEEQEEEVYFMSFAEIFEPCKAGGNTEKDDRWALWESERALMPGLSTTAYAFYTSLGWFVGFTAVLATFLLELLNPTYVLATGFYYLCKESQKQGPYVQYPVSIILLPPIPFLLLSDQLIFIMGVILSETFGLTACLMIAVLGGCDVAFKWLVYIRRMCHLTRWAYRGFHKDWVLKRTFPPAVNKPESKEKKVTSQDIPV